MLSRLLKLQLWNAFALHRLALGDVALVYLDQWWRWFRVVFATVGYGPAGLKETGRSWGKGNELGGYGMELDLYAVWTQPECPFLLAIFNWLGYACIQKQYRFYVERKVGEYRFNKDVFVHPIFGIFALKSFCFFFPALQNHLTSPYSLSKSVISITLRGQGACEVLPSAVGYCGKTENLRDRLRKYIHKCGINAVSCQAGFLAPL